MEVIQFNSKKRETYRVRVEHSILFECALGIAALTNQSLIDTLEKKNWHKERFDEALKKELSYVKLHNTWKALLQILHHDSFPSLQDFTQFIQQLDSGTLKYISLPYLGEDLEPLRKKASKGEKNAIRQLSNEVSDHAFFPSYIQFISEVDELTLKQHLQDVMTYWYKAVIEPEEEELKDLLERDYVAKEKMIHKLEPEAFVEWATGGMTYKPEPSVHHVLLIPHHTYRPWNVEADLPDTKVFYYPVSNDSLYQNDPYIPSQMLVQKYKALGDEVRLRLVKYLYEKERSLQELTTILQMGKSTLHHHLKMLKSARIVESSHSTYRLNKRTIDSMPIDLEQFLGISDDEA
ncbi:ArsR/SmtB family transcription factor [Halobacillus sp. B23F22_1]|uniref:ArsR/SmtB family transcription factor n=1 Tax=Halobacillus sp. B23F22_1 TaxID=3459514 RepID=UPI00373F8C7E